MHAKMVGKSMSGNSVKNFLMLQGGANPFFKVLGAELQALGYGVQRINFCGGDWLFWHGADTIDYRGSQEAFGEFLIGYAKNKGFTDLIVFGDVRPLHKVAIAWACANNVRVHVMDEGHMRPHWLTFERGGTNGLSPIPSDPKWHLETARELTSQDAPEKVGGGMHLRIRYDILYNVANTLMLWRYPNYRTHRPYNIYVDYWSWIKRLIHIRADAQGANVDIDKLIKSAQPFYLFALQLDTDTQIRVHSKFGGVPGSISAVIEDFAANAPPDTVLCIKNHPLDNAMINYRRLVADQARRLGIEERVVYVDGGDLNALIQKCLGVVLVNSTTGMSALDQGKPLIALGSAIFDMEGLTFQGSLKDFWTALQPPNKSLFRKFCEVLLATSLINGNLYSDRGVAVGVKAAIKMLARDTAPFEGAPKPNRPRDPGRV